MVGKTTFQSLASDTKIMKTADVPSKASEKIPKSISSCLLNSVNSKSSVKRGFTKYNVAQRSDKKIGAKSSFFRYSINKDCNKKPMMDDRDEKGYNSVHESKN